MLYIYLIKSAKRNAAYKSAGKEERADKKTIFGKERARLRSQGGKERIKNRFLGKSALV